MKENNELTLVKPEFNGEIQAKIKSLGEIESNIKEVQNYAVELNNYYKNIVFTEDTMKIAKDEKSKVNKFKKIVAVLAALAILTSGWYFFYCLKTPLHNIALIADAVRQHDLKTFEKHVDMDNLYSKAYDDVVAVTFGPDKNANPIIVAIVKGIKGLAVPLLTSETRSYIIHGDKPEGDAEVQKSIPAGNENGAEIVDNLKSRTGFGSLKYEGVENTDINDGNAIVSIKLRDEKLSKDFILKIKMQQLDDGLWRLLEITNLQDFMKEREAGRIKQAGSRTDCFQR